MEADSAIPVFDQAVSSDDRRTIMSFCYQFCHELEDFMMGRSDGSFKLRKPPCDLINKPDREFDLFKKFDKKQQLDYYGSSSADAHDTPAIQPEAADTPGISSMSKGPSLHVLENAAKSAVLLERLIISRDEDGGPDPKMRSKMRERIYPNLAVMSFCLAAAIALLPIPKETSRLSSPLQYDLLYLALALNFSIVIVTIEISTKFPAAGQALNVVGTLLATLTALATALCFPLSIGLCCVLLFLIFILSVPGSISACQRLIKLGEESPFNSTSSRKSATVQATA